MKPVESLTNQCRQCFLGYLKRSDTRKGEIIEIADSSWRMCLLQHQLILKLRTRLAEATCKTQDKIINLQDQLVKNKDEEIERLKSLAEKVEDSVKLYSDAVGSAAQQVTCPPELKHSVREAVHEAVQEEGQTRSLMIFGLKEEKDLNLEGKVVEVFEQMSEKPRIVDVERLGRHSEEKVWPVKVTLSSSSAVKALVRQGYRLSKNDKFKQVYLAPDRSKDERNKHKELVLKLKEKKTTRPDLHHRIKDGTIVSVVRNNNG